MKTKEVQKCSQINDPWDTLFTERISLVFAKLFAKWGLKPNTVTLMSIISGVAGAVLFVFDNLWLTIAGIVLEILGAIFDCADGQVARITHKGSRIGRFFDGFGDSVVYTSIYIGICLRILLHDNIPFTDTPWSFWILFAVPLAAYFHPRQARLADRYKQVFMFMTRNAHGSELDRREALEKEYKGTGKNIFENFMISSYISYTKTQEKESPVTTKLIKKIDENNGEIPEKITKMYSSHLGLAKATNLLVFNLRTYILFALLIADHFVGNGLTVWLFAIIVFVFEPIALIVEYKFEKLAKKALEEGF